MYEIILNWQNKIRKKLLEDVFFKKCNDGLTSRQTHHPTKNLTIQIMENKERYHNATSITKHPKVDSNHWPHHTNVSTFSALSQLSYLG